MLRNRRKARLLDDPFSRLPVNKLPIDKIPFGTPFNSGITHGNPPFKAKQDIRTSRRFGDSRDITYGKRYDIRRRVW